MKIGDMAEQTGIPVETVRYYEKIGLLPAPDRQANGYRRYRQSHLDRLLFIRRCRNLDMAQDEIRELVRLADQPEADCTQVDALLARHLEHVRQRLAELRQLERTLSHLQQACSEGRTVAECGILGGLSDDLPSEPAPTGHNHIPGSHGTR
ncbi:Cd(II)/Pb(II)-responsive transcriptional regulator [Marinobacter daqiaonensis]|uniref:Cd(II)/Pb(II)-responsive transcriptional regulator n=1 Tax=Marinobacter daqiaonensis TaxID=650891 RepID=A0A1I6HRH0_9GAMM|nr:Cd(II)/Pb(II)-responsive transcriptional regulator [Marinobacter daqiaonensis]SFR56870.1 Cd(II)/Pb(II)-responsive transcriptional regulator [Marinobacter daqiaonensis]